MGILRPRSLSISPNTPPPLLPLTSPTSPPTPQHNQTKIRSPKPLTLFIFTICLIGILLFVSPDHRMSDLGFVESESTKRNNNNVVQLNRKDIRTPNSKPSLEEELEQEESESNQDVFQININVDNRRNNALFQDEDDEQEVGKQKEEILPLLVNNTDTSQGVDMVSDDNVSNKNEIVKDINIPAKSPVENEMIEHVVNADERVVVAKKEVATKPDSVVVKGNKTPVQAKKQEDDEEDEELEVDEGDNDDIVNSLLPDESKRDTSGEMNVELSDPKQPIQARLKNLNLQADEKNDVEEDAEVDVNENSRSRRMRRRGRALNTSF